MTLRIIGAGLGRTGTMSLKFALEHLGFGPCCHMIEVLANLPTALPKWLDVVAGRPDWDAVFDGYASSVDYPGCTYWRQHLDLYPDAKVILSVRDPDSWAASANETIFSGQMRAMIDIPAMKTFFDSAVHAEVDGHTEDRAWLADYFQRWNADVIAAVPPERLLVFEARQGWEPLCAFLGVPLPDDVPYPRVNSREEMVQRNLGQIEAARTQASTQGMVPTLEQIAAMSAGRMQMMRAAAFPQGHKA